MAPSIKNLRDTITKINPRDLVYPGIILLFFILVGILFSLATQFIAKNINNAFSSDTGAESSALNMANYTLVSKKLGFSTEVGASVATSTSSPAEAVSTAQVLDKKSLTLTILNSTAKKGVATTLAEALQTSGFSKATTGNEKRLYATTTVVIKESKKDYETLLLEAVRKTYPDAVVTTTTAGTIDATIIIGTK